jgi:hypothetical protein
MDASNRLARDGRTAGPIDRPHLRQGSGAAPTLCPMPHPANVEINAGRSTFHMPALGTDVIPSFSLLILLLALSKHGIVAGRGWHSRSSSLAYDSPRPDVWSPPPVHFL